MINKSEPGSISCARCGFRRVCFPARSARDSASAPQRPGVRRRQFARGTTLFHAGDRLSAVYALRSGCVKNVVLTPGGEEQVTNFYLPGEVVGLGALADLRFHSSAIAAELTRCCEIPWAPLVQRMATSLELVTELIGLIARTAGSAQDFAVSAMRQSALRRVAGFLVAMRTRRCERGFEGQRFRLGLRRRDIASYLGLTLETVSRCFSELARRDLILVRARYIELLRYGDLERTALGE